MRVNPAIVKPPFPFPQRPTVSLRDAFTAKRLDERIDGRDLKLREALKPADKVSVKRGPDGLMHAPNGDPLMEVRREDGTRVYVDPKTNEYYVGGSQVYIRQPQSESTRGPYKLPSDVQFSKDDFSSVDVRYLQGIANGGSIKLPPIVKPTPPIVPPTPWPVLQDEFV